MGVCKRHRRKITVNGGNFIWYVREDYDSPLYLLNIASEDKNLVLSCPLKTNISYIISKGKSFQRTKTNGCWNRYLLPFETPEIITPEFVERLISWATGEPDAVKIPYDGKNIIV